MILIFIIVTQVIFVCGGGFFFSLEYLQNECYYYIVRFFSGENILVIYPTNDLVDPVLLVSI